MQEYADEIARLSGGIPIQVIGDDTIVFYRGKNYVQPKVMSPVDTLSKKRALENSKYEQSLESMRRFISIAEKELELYYKYLALYGDPNDRNPCSILDKPRTRQQPVIIKGANEASTFSTVDACPQDGYRFEIETMKKYLNIKKTSLNTKIVLRRMIFTLVKLMIQIEGR